MGKNIKLKKVRCGLLNRKNDINACIGTKVDPKLPNENHIIK